MKSTSVHRAPLFDLIAHNFGTLHGSSEQKDVPVIENTAATSTDSHFDFAAAKHNSQFICDFQRQDKRNCKRLTPDVVVKFNCAEFDETTQDVRTHLDLGADANDIALLHPTDQHACIKVPLCVLMDHVTVRICKHCPQCIVT